MPGVLETHIGRSYESPLSKTPMNRSRAWSARKAQTTFAHRSGGLRFRLPFVFPLYGLNALPAKADRLTNPKRRIVDDLHRPDTTAC